MREVWRGYAAAWECDELGHLNVAHYLAKAMEGVAGFAIDLGLTDAFTDKAFSTVRPREIHIRFLKECRPGTPLSAFAGVYEIGADGAGVYMELRHSATGEVSAAFRFTLNHISVRTGERFSWRADTLDQLDAAKIEPPAATAPRGVDLTTPAETDVSTARADALGMDMIGRGVIEPHECTVFGWYRPATVISRISSSVTNFSRGFPEESAQAAGEADGPRLGSALMEARMVFRGWPRAGSAYVIRTGVVEAGDRVRRLVHWVLDPVTGRPWASMEGVAMLMDLDARKAVVPAPDMQQKLRESVIADLRV